MTWKRSQPAAKSPIRDREAMLAALSELVERARDQSDDVLEREMRQALGDEFMELMAHLPRTARLPLRDLEAVLIFVASRIARDHGAAVLERLLAQAGELGRLIADADAA